MRIRSIRPEFWSSEDVAAMDWHTRLVFIGLWSYVDDNGVGRDIERLIVTALFPLDEDLSESSLRVHGALKHLETGGQVTRYSVDGKPYLHITAWENNQKVNRPSEGRYPLPTCENAVPHGALSESSVSPHDRLSAGEGEKGRRGEGEKSLSSDTSDTTDDRFEEFWDTYDKKDGRKRCVTAYRAALKKPGVTPDLLIAAAASYIAWVKSEGKHPQYTKNPLTWLHGEHWTDERVARQPPQSRAQGWLDLARDLGDQQQPTNIRQIGGPR